MSSPSNIWEQELRAAVEAILDEHLRALQGRIQHRLRQTLHETVESAITEILPEVNTALQARLEQWSAKMLRSRFVPSPPEPPPLPKAAPPEPERWEWLAPLLAAERPSDILQLLLQAAVAARDRAALVLVQGRRLSLWQQAGFELPASWSADESELAKLLSTVQPLTPELWARLGRGEDAAGQLFPILVNGRVIALLLWAPATGQREEQRRLEVVGNAVKIAALLLGASAQRVAAEPAGAEEAASPETAAETTPPTFAPAPFAPVDDALAAPVESLPPAEAPSCAFAEPAFPEPMPAAPIWDEIAPAAAAPAGAEEIAAQINQPAPDAAAPVITFPDAWSPVAPPEAEAEPLPPAPVWEEPAPLAPVAEVPVVEAERPPDPEPAPAQTAAPAPPPASAALPVALPPLPPPASPLEARAQRFAKVLMQDLEIYLRRDRPEDLDRARQGNNVYEALQPELERCRKSFVEKFPPGSGIPLAILDDALVRYLCQGERRQLGPGFPGWSSAD